MNLPLLKRITLAVAISGVLLSIVAGMIYGVPGLVSGAAGALVAMANWQAIRWLAEQVTGQAVRSKGRLMILAAVKTTALMAVCWIALTQLGLDSRAFIIGISALVAGIVIGPLTMPETSDTDSPRLPRGETTWLIPSNTQLTLSLNTGRGSARFPTSIP